MGPVIRRKPGSEASRELDKTSLIAQCRHKETGTKEAGNVLRPNAPESFMFSVQAQHLAQKTSSIMIKLHRAAAIDDDHDEELSR